MIYNFKSLNIWHRSRELVKAIYKATDGFPEQEKFGLTLQVRRSAISVPSNISEGCGRSTKKELCRFLDIAIGSICELETQIYLALDIKYISDIEQEKIINEISEIRRMMVKFKQSMSG